MPSTRSQAGVDTPAGEAAEVAEALEEAAEVAVFGEPLTEDLPDF